MSRRRPIRFLPPDALAGRRPACGMPVAPGRDAPGRPGFDQVLESAAQLISVFVVAVVAGSLRDRGEGDVQLAQKLRDLRGPVAIAARPVPVRVVGVASGRAAVGGGGAVGGDHGHTPAGLRVGGGGGGQLLGGLRVEQAPARGLAGSIRPAEQGAGRDQQVDQRRERRPAAGAVPSWPGRPRAGPATLAVLAVLAVLVLAVVLMVPGLEVRGLLTRVRRARG
jgi:hypothetical protein